MDTEKTLQEMSSTEKVQTCMNFIHKARGFSTEQTQWAPEFLSLTTVESADFNPDMPTVVFRLRTQQHMSNTLGFMHGGCVTTFIDNATTWAGFGDPTYWQPGFDLGQVIRAAAADFGVSRNLNSTFVRPVPLNQDVLLTCRIQSNSKRYMHITYELRDALSGKKLAVGSHDKAKLPKPASKL